MNFGVAALGTDTVNSIRSPSSACNLVGFKPTAGLVSKTGAIPSSFTQDNVGPIARTIEDASKLLSVISGYDAEDPSTAWSVGNTCNSFAPHLVAEGLRGKRIGILRSFLGKETIHEEVNAVFESCIKAMKNEGAVFVGIDEDLDAVKLQSEISPDLYEFKPALNSYLGKLDDIPIPRSGFPSQCR